MTYDIIGQNYDIIVSTMISGVPRFQMYLYCFQNHDGPAYMVLLHLGFAQAYFFIILCFMMWDCSTNNIFIRIQA